MVRVRHEAATRPDADVAASSGTARDGSADSLFTVAPRRPGTIPTLHQLCCDFIVNAVINLENAPSILEFAKMHNVGGLAQRSERFIVAAWRAISEMHEEAVLRDALGAEAYEALARDQAELVKPKLGSVVDTPVAPAAAASAVAPPAAAAVAAAKSPGTTGDPDAKAAPPAAAATATATPQLSEAAERARRRFSFGGGGETCERCGKRVYPAEKAQGIKKIYHMECFRCSTCNTKLHPHSYELTEEGAPLCKVHHKQHLDATRRSSLCNSTPSIGGQFYLPDTTCVRCGKRVFATEMQCASAHQGGHGDTQCYHKSCFRCAECNRGPLRPDDWVVDVDSSELLCRAHFKSRQDARASAR